MDEAGRDLVLRLARTLGAGLVETHISWVLLTATLAYKIKKPVRLPFVDYATPRQRLHFCEEEVRLNARLAPGMYLGVSRITGDAQDPRLDGDGPVLEYAVRMRRFPPGALFSERLRAGVLAPQLVDRLAVRLAAMHIAATPTYAVPDDPQGTRPLLRAQAALQGARDLFQHGEDLALQEWLAAQWHKLAAGWQQRLHDGHVREGHGDLHLANVAVVDGDVVAFDCIEFDAALRTLDVVDDAAFALMDFAARGDASLGWRFVNGWLEGTGEYEGLPLLPFWLVGHALVRAQVEALRGARPAARRYARAALGWMRPTAPRLIITCGLPGSGKTTAAGKLLEHFGAIRVRSDVERKRLFGLGPLASTRASGIDAYDADTTRRTYERLFALAASTLRAGLPVVLDAAFLRRAERDGAREVARRQAVPFSIVACDAPAEVLRARLRARAADASEADEAVLERLLAVAEPLGPDEIPQARHDGWLH